MTITKLIRVFGLDFYRSVVKPVGSPGTLSLQSLQLLAIDYRPTRIFSTSLTLRKKMVCCKCKTVGIVIYNSLYLSS